MLKCVSMIRGGLFDINEFKQYLLKIYFLVRLKIIKDGRDWLSFEYVPFELLIYVETEQFLMKACLQRPFHSD